MFKRILVPLDGSDTSTKAMDTAMQMTRESGGQLRLLHVMEEAAFMTGYDPMGGSSAQLMAAVRDSAAAILAQARAKVSEAGLQVETVLHDKPGQRLAEVVAEAATGWPADLIVVGTHGRRGVGRVLLGSGAEQIIRSAPVPVLVIRG